jgi:hypothetical protein
MKALFSTLLLCLAIFISNAQTSSDIYLFDIQMNNNSLKLINGKNLTEREGYDNQPHFVDDRALLYTSQRGDQTDIYAFDFVQNTAGNLTRTPNTSEYSATLTSDKGFISTIMVEEDGTQRLWKFPITGGTPTLVLDDIKPVGYHAWYNEKLALFVLGRPATLQVANALTQEVSTITGNIGRCLAPIPASGKISFVHKEAGKAWMIKSLDMNTMEIADIVETLEGSEDYAWAGPNRLIMAKDSKVFECVLDGDKTWKEIADLSDMGITKLSRIAIDKGIKRLAIVGE